MPRNVPVLTHLGEVALDPELCLVAQLSWYGAGCHFVQCALAPNHEGEHTFPLEEA